MHKIVPVYRSSSKFDKSDQLCNDIIMETNNIWLFETTDPTKFYVNYSFLLVLTDIIILFVVL